METKITSFDLSRPQGNWRIIAETMAASLPKLYSQENEKDPLVHFKFFITCSNWTWYILEGEWKEDDFLMFGYVEGHESELGYISLKELGSVRNQLNLGVEYDTDLPPESWSV